MRSCSARSSRAKCSSTARSRGRRAPASLGKACAATHPPRDHRETTSPETPACGRWPAVRSRPLPALCACTISMRSLAMSAFNCRVLRAMRSGLIVSACIGSHSPPKRAQFADQRAFAAGDEGAGAGLQQRLRDIDRGVADRIVAQRRHQLQDGGAGKRARLGSGGDHHRHPSRAPLALQGRR